jgi:hypothetical protein
LLDYFFKLYYFRLNKALREQRAIFRFTFVISSRRSNNKDTGAGR